VIEIDGLSESESEFLRKVIVGIPDYCGAQVRSDLSHLRQGAGYPLL
jgi:hypothetical protein